MAAIHCVLNLLQQGDHVIAGNDLYGGTYRLLRTLYEKFGVQTTFVDLTDLGSCRPRSGPEHATGDAGDADQPAAALLRPRRPSPRSAAAAC
jgi:hypothetical protein